MRQPYPNSPSTFAMPKVPTRRTRGRGGRGRGRGRGSRYNSRQGGDVEHFDTNKPFEVLALVQGHLIGGLMGMRGETIKEYREQSGCSVRVSGEAPGVTQRQITFTGPPDRVISAIEMVVKNIVAQHRRLEGISWISRLYWSHGGVKKAYTLGEKKSTENQPSSSQEGGRELGSSGRIDSEDHKTNLGSASSQPEEEKDVTVDFVLLVDNRGASAIIGKNGARIRKLKDSSGAYISVSKNFVPGASHRSVLVKGVESTLLNALRMLVDQLAGKGNPISPVQRAPPPPRPPPNMQLPFQTPFYLRTPRPNAPEFENSYYMSTPKLSKNLERVENKGLNQFGISERGSNESKLQNEILGPDESFEEGEIEELDPEAVEITIEASPQLDESPAKSPPPLTTDYKESVDIKGMIEKLRDAKIDTQAEALKAISSITDPEDVRKLVENGLVVRLSHLLNPHITQPRVDIILNALRSINNILTEGKDEVPNRYARKIKDSGAIQLIEQLQTHKSMDVYHRAIQILDHFPNRGRPDMFPERRRQPVR
eukprot:625126-Amorphochlora_amoeboformis.AAC.1